MAFDDLIKKKKEESDDDNFYEELVEEFERYWGWKNLKDSMDKKKQEAHIKNLNEQIKKANGVK